MVILIVGALLILAYCTDSNQSSNFQDVIYSMCGKKWQTINSLCIILYMFGCCITFFIIIGDQLDQSKHWNLKLTWKFRFKWLIFSNNMYIWRGAIRALVFPQKVYYSSYIDFVYFTIVLSKEDWFSYISKVCLNTSIKLYKKGKI